MSLALGNNGAGPDDAEDRRVRELFDGWAERHAAHHQRGYLGWLGVRDWRALVELLIPVRGQRALDVGCGPGLYVRGLTELGLQVWAVDRSAAMVAQVRAVAHHASVADVETLSLGQEFDSVLCVGVFDYVHDADRCVANLAHHLRPGGRMVIGAPRRSIGGYLYRLCYYLVHGVWIRLYTRRGLDAAAAASGLKCVGSRHPFVHNLMVAWVRPASPSLP